MKKLINISLIVAFIFTLTSCAQNKTKEGDTTTAQTKPTVELISSTDLNIKLGDIQLIDVRTPKEYNSGHIKGAKNINFFDDDFVAQISKLDQDKNLFIYCRSGNRSGKASKKIEAIGFPKVYDLKGGFLNWNEKGLEVIK